MSIIYQENNDNIDFNEVHQILVDAFDGRGFLSTDKIENAFTNSSKVVYAFDDKKLIGCARAISDGEWSVIYNVAISPLYQGKGVGKGLIYSLINQLKGQHIFTYTHPQTVSFYERLGFNRSKQAFKYALFNDEEELNRMEQIGFYLPRGYKFEEEFYREEKKKLIDKKTNVNIRYSSNYNDVNIKDIVNVLEKAFGRERDLNTVKKEFDNSHNYSFAFDGNKLIGCARLVGDKTEYAILLNVAVLPEYQGLGIATKIINNLAAQVPTYNIFIHAHPGSANYYNSKKEFRRYKTAFIYNDGSLLKDEMGKKFAIPSGFRYPDEFDKEYMKYYKGKIYGKIK